MAPMGSYESTVEQVEELMRGPANPLNGSQFSQEYFRLLADRNQLPVAQYRGQLLDLIQKHHVLVITSGTGSGKTTQIPMFLALAHGIDDLEKEKKRFTVAQPRRIATVNTAKRVAEESDVKCGKHVGYNVRGENKVDNNTTRVEVETDGILLRYLKLNPKCPRYRAVFMDEAHERTVNNDICMALLKYAMVKRFKTKNPLKVIIMSATLNMEAFKQYFGLEMGGSVHVPASLHIPGATFPVQTHFLEKATSDPISTAARMVVDELHGRKEPGDILVFVSGHFEIERCIGLIKNFFKDAKKKLPQLGALDARPLSAKSSSKETDAVFLPPPTTAVNGMDRVVIVATPVAETSITIPRVAFVVDTCMVKVKVYDPETNSHFFREVPASKAATRQRAGRTGRTGPGHCFRMLTAKQYDTLDPFPAPEISKSKFLEPMLSVVGAQHNPLDFDLMTPPTPDAFLRALDEMHWLDLLDENCETQVKLSSRGKFADDMPMKPTMAMALEASAGLGCGCEMLTIVSMVSALDQRRLWRRTRDDEEFQFAQVVRRWKNCYGDHLSYLEIFYGFTLAANKKQFCEDNFLVRDTLEEASNIRTNFAEYMKKAQLEIKHLDRHDKNYYSTILMGLCAGYFVQCAFLSDDESCYQVFRTGVKAVSNCVGIMDKEFRDRKWLIFEDVTRTKKETVFDTVSVVKLEWLMAAHPYYFDPNVQKRDSTVKKKLFDCAARQANDEDLLWDDE